MLKRKYDQSMDQLRGILDFPWHNREFYGAWLAQSYFYSRRVTRMLLLASAHTSLAKSKLHRRLATHASEEKGHDLLAERDIKDLGLDLQKIGEFPITKAFYGYQYFTIQNVSVESFFGWILVLEGLAITWGKEILRLVREAKSAPTRFLDIHVHEDPSHVSSAFDAVTNFDAACMPDLTANMGLTVDMYYQILCACKEFAQKESIDLSA